MISEIDYIEEYKLPYEKTKWGLFYISYREEGQLQLQKQLEKYKNEYASLIQQIKDKNIYEIGKFLQHIFYQTQWNEITKSYQTPDILLRHSKRKRSDIEWFQDNNKHEDICSKVVKSYIKRYLLQYKEVKAYYQQRKIELEIQHKEEHKQYASTKIICPFCSKTFSRTNLSRHKKTNKKCLEIQSRL